MTPRRQQAASNDVAGTGAKRAPCGQLDEPDRSAGAARVCQHRRAVPRHDECVGEGEIRELIVATNPTVEGEATAHYLAQLARHAGVRASRLAHGVPLGSELEFIDRGTLAHAFGGRLDLI